MSAGFLEAFYGACFALVGWLVLSIMKLTLAIKSLEEHIQPLTADMPKIKKDLNALHAWKRDISKSNGKDDDTE